MALAFPSMTPVRDKYLPLGGVSRAALERVAQWPVRQAIMKEFVGNLQSRDLKVSSEAARLTAENVGSYGMLGASWVAQLPMVVAMSWNPLSVVAGGSAAVAQQMLKTTSGINYVAMETFNASVRATRE